MSYKSENWEEKLEQVRAHVQLKEGSVEKSADEILNDQIEEELATFFQEDEIVEDNLELDEKNMSSGDMIKKLFKLKNEKQVNGVANLLNMTDAKVLQSMQKQNPKGFLRMAEKMGELPAMEEVQEEVKEESVEKTIEKLAERNMLGRLAKQLQLNEQGKEQLFNYFEKGELKQ